MDHGEDVRVGSAVYDPLPLPGHVLILWTERRHLSRHPPRPEQRGAGSNRVFLLQKLIVLCFCAADKTEGVPLNTPEANEELVLQQNSEDKVDNTFSRHRKQVLPDQVPL